MEKKSKKVFTCEYAIVCAEYKKDKCPCQLANTKKNQVVFDSMNRNKQEVKMTTKKEAGTLHTLKVMVLVGGIAAITYYVIFITAQPTIKEVTRNLVGWFN